MSRRPKRLRRAAERRAVERRVAEPRRVQRQGRSRVQRLGLERAPELARARWAAWGPSSRARARSAKRARPPRAESELP